MATIGRRHTLPVIRAAGPGLYLDGGELGEILLPGKYIPATLKPKDLIDVFIHLDSEDRLVASTQFPRAMVGDFAGLEVLSINRNVGAFLDWGLDKDLLLPFREQESPVQVGQTVVVHVDFDERSSRIVATTRLRRHLSSEPPNYRPGQPVEMLIVADSPLGWKALVEKSHMGLLYRDAVPTPPRIGQRLNGFVRALRPDGKIDLSIHPAGYKKVAPLTEQILAALKAAGGKLMFDDSTPPETVRAKFGVSKKAFKQALGFLYKKRRIAFAEQGITLLDNSTFTPGLPTGPGKATPKSPTPMPPATAGPVEPAKNARPARPERPVPARLPYVAARKTTAVPAQTKPGFASKPSSTARPSGPSRHQDSGARKPRS